MKNCFLTLTLFVLILVPLQDLWAQDCSSCDTGNPEFTLYLDPLVTGVNGGGFTTAAQFDVYLLNNTASDLKLTTIEFSMAINESLVTSVANITSDATFFLNSLLFDPVGGNFVTIIDNYPPNLINLNANGVTYVSEYEYDHSVVGPANPPQCIVPGIATQILTVFMTFDGTQTFLDNSMPNNIFDPNYLCNAGFFMPFPGECLFAEPNVNNQFGFVDVNGNPLLINCYDVICDNPFNFLPVEMASFTGKAVERDNLLEWTTLTEDHSIWHVVERSEDPSQVPFREIGRVEAAGISNETLDYSFIDDAPLPVGYYRIKTIDEEGQNEYSEIIVIKRTGDFEVLNVSPNPTSGNVDILLNLEESSDITVSVLDPLGRVMMTDEFENESGLIQKQLDLEGIGTGIYFVQLETETGSSITKIIKE
ncbi:MAG: T9SS type A sorting domain-containing protein [Bacteroidota bacterium]